ncbi:hypothetical protein Poli38472_002230 [Pythium oligandrum]|uniref:SH2 domain-containing protein n=1 Tax=Pythium oligandrum TaxID=41045 RepID=A0A8K1CHS1_PYTOL|nr:hypothetical protein Poli38472_002230 [Pythium oligandrum]|eukprot:TMW63289.1 hypothetical protein Poli38472_002230 [Pythium oligandrum]
MASSDDERRGGASPMVSDSDSGAEEELKNKSKKRKLTKPSSKKSKKKSKKSKVIEDSDDENEKRPKSSFIEDEASESEDGKEGDSDDSDDDDDDGDKNEYEADGFVVDDMDDDESDEDGGRHRRRRKKKEKKLRRLKQKIDDIDDEDLMLVRENLGMDTGPARSDSEDEDMDRSSKKRKDDSGLMSRELSYRMFGDSDDEEEEAAPARNNNNYMGADEYESDDIDEFIVDDDEEGREGPRRRRKQVSLPASMQGPSVYQMGEAEELFGDMEGFLEATRGALSGEGQAAPKSKKAALLEKYEPDVLKEHMMTPEIISVRDRDLPERYQQLFDGRQFPDAEDRADESEWIGEALKNKMGDKYISSGEVVSAIDSVLRFYHDEKLEPAFVQRYCKEFWKPAGLRTAHLYEILDLDIKWDKLDRKRKSLQAIMQRTVDMSSAKESSFVRECYNRMFRVPNEKCYQDLTEFFALDMDSSKDEASSDRKYRRPVRRNFYQICTKAGLRKLANAFTMNATVLGGLLVGVDHDESVREVPTPQDSPGMFGQSFTSKEFPTVDDVMRGARHIAATKIAAEPNVRKCMRDLFRQNALLFTQATTKGQEEIDEFHYAHGLQYLEGMPISEVFAHGDVWLRLTRAEKEGLMTISITNDRLQDLIDPLNAVFMDGSNDADEEWENQRYQTLQEAISSFMVPSFENELKRDLVVSSREYLVKECGHRMRERLLVRPFESKDGTEPFIVSIWVEGGPDAIAHMAAIDENGELVDKTQGYCRREERHIRTLTNTLFRFLQEHPRTQVVVINVSGGMKCMDMGELVDAVRHELGRNNANRFGNNDGKDWMEILFLKDDVATMYSRSKRAELEFPEESEPIRAAIGLGRYLRSPASELSAMWGNVTLDEPTRGRELLYLNVHPMQHSLGKEMLLREYDRVFAQVINKFGVDINLLANHKHTSYQLQFICGLGPVKAASLLDKVRAKSYIERRQELLSKGMVGKIVYRNCAGFVRIRERDALKEAPLNPLDDTRIHPESYYMAVKMCGDANNNSTIDMYDPNQYSYAVEETMFQSATAIRGKGSSRTERLGDNEIQDALSELDLPAYASRLEQQKKGPKLLTLEYIKRELRYPYFDKRHPYQMPREEELFVLLSGENKDTFQEGIIVPCTLLHMAGGEFVRVRLQNGMRATLKKDLLPDYLTDDHGAYVRNNGFPKGLTVNARVLCIKKDPNGRFEAQLGCNRRALMDFEMTFNPEKLLPYARRNQIVDDTKIRLDKLLNRLVLEDEKDVYSSDRRGGQARRKKRQIGHPLFKNVNCQSAMQELRKGTEGDVVIRPSTLGSDHLTLTWKMLDGVYRHFDILELNKPSEARLGEKLMIKEETFDSIDELVARFVDPMNDLVREVVQFKYFKNISLEEVHEDLIKQKKAHPSRIPYIIHLYNKFPGCFSITFIARTTPHSCHMEVKSGGFRFFGRIESSLLPTLNQALQFFKMKALVAQPTQPSRSSHSSSSYQRPESSNSVPFAQQRPPSSSSGNYRDSGNGYSHSSGSGDRYRQESRFDSRYDDRRDGGGSYSRYNDGGRYQDGGRYR